MWELQPSIVTRTHAELDLTNQAAVQAFFAKEKLGWVPEITIDQMIVEMVASDLDQAKQHALLSKHGFSVAVGKEN